MAERYTARPGDFPGEWVVWDRATDRAAHAKTSRDEDGAQKTAKRYSAIYLEWMSR